MLRQSPAVTAEKKKEADARRQSPPTGCNGTARCRATGHGCARLAKLGPHRRSGSAWASCTDDSLGGTPCSADVEMVEWRHYRSFPGSPAIYFAVRFRVTGATPGCFADLDFRFKLTQRDRVIPVRCGGGFEIRARSGELRLVVARQQSGLRLPRLVALQRPLPVQVDLGVVLARAAGHPLPGLRGGRAMTPDVARLAIGSFRAF